MRIAFGKYWHHRLPGGYLLEHLPSNRLMSFQNSNVVISGIVWTSKKKKGGGAGAIAGAAPFYNCLEFSPKLGVPFACGRL